MEYKSVLSLEKDIERMAAFLKSDASYGYLIIPIDTFRIIQTYIILHLYINA